MDLKTGIFSLALGALLLGSTARADDTQQFQAPRSDRDYARGPSQDRAPDGRFYRRQPPPAPQNQQGRYELKQVQQWVPGRNEQTWVPQDCSYRSRWGHSQCRGGYYTQQWVEGHYETAEQWVWVPSQWHRGSGWGSPASYWHG